MSTCRGLPARRSSISPRLRVSIDADGKVSLAGQAVSTTDLELRFREAVGRDAQVEMHLMADRATRYETVAETMSAARRAGLSKIGFVTQPVTGVVLEESLKPDLQEAV